MPQLLYIQFYFVTIATILGTGILGLPVTLGNSGFLPFLFPFITSFVMQVILILVFTEILQIAYHHSLRKEAEGTSIESVPLDRMADSNEDIGEPTSPGEFDAQDKIAEDLDIPIVMPNLHMIGELFLSKTGAFCFDIILALGFVSVLISYALAGSEAYAEVMHLNVLTTIPIFVCVLTFVVIFLQFLVQPVISVLTLIKGGMFVGCVIVTFLVGAKIDREVTDNFGSIGEPFLMGTVALGGIINIMPILFARIKPNADQIIKFNIAVIAGLSTCLILNIMWCWTILKIVPQLNECYAEIEQRGVEMNLSSNPVTQKVCSETSLEKARMNGEIATIPLTDIIMSDYPEYGYVAVVTQFFIMVSITVSYLTFGSAMHHMVSGVVDSFWTSKGGCISGYLKLTNTSPQHSPDDTMVGIFKVTSILKSCVSVLCFLAVLCVALSNPKGFIKVLDRVTSLSQNLQNSVFVPLMLVTIKRSPEYCKLRLSFKLHTVFYCLYVLVTLFYGTAVVYDLVVWTKAILSY